MAKKMRNVEPAPPPTALGGMSGGFNPFESVDFLNSENNTSPAFCKECGVKMVYKVNESNNGYGAECPNCDGPSYSD